MALVPFLLQRQLNNYNRDLAPKPKTVTIWLFKKKKKVCIPCSKKSRVAMLPYTIHWDQQMGTHKGILGIVL